FKRNIRKDLKVDPVKSIFTVYKDKNTKKIVKESVKFTSKQYDGGTASYDLIKPIHPGLVNNHKFIGYTISEHIAGTSKTVKALLVQRVFSKYKMAPFDFPNEAGIKVKNIDK
ncbi:hypothetical protein, partial [Lactiplantibacillus plantarum]|uniref:hypothetical protein n=1 Tax=Lactiplantibacillus plantarum TaxID=1590 RepID=UPI001300DC36